MTPTLPTSCGSLPPEGALAQGPGQAGAAFLWNARSGSSTRIHSTFQQGDTP